VPENISQIASEPAGKITLAGVAICLVGISIAALAGLTKERRMSEAQKRSAIAEFSFTKGILVATFSGIMSACFSFALTAGNPIGNAAVAAGTRPLWTGLPKLVVVLLGGFTTNFIWCALLNIKNKTSYQYWSWQVRPEHATTSAVRGGANSGPVPGGSNSAEVEVPLLRNYVFSALAGTVWYFQFFFYTMGETKMGDFRFASWTLHMASIIIFSTMWGWIFHEWKDSGRKAHGLITAGIAVLIFSTIVIGYGTLLKSGGTLGDIWRLIFGKNT
jgi:L-rhamnose-H+ transport protein